MTGRIAVYAEARSLAGESPCAKTQGLFLCLVDVGHGDIEVHLLRVAGIGPLWWLQVRCELEGQPRAVGCVTDDHPVVVVLHPLHAEQFLIEGRQPAWVRAVNYESVPPSDHRPSLHRLPATWPAARLPVIPRPPDRCRGLAAEDHSQGWRLRHRVSDAPPGAPLMVSFHGERLPGDRRTALPSVQAWCCGFVAPGTACLRMRGRRPAAAPATGGLPPIGRGQAAAPESPSSPAIHPQLQLQAATLTPPHEFSQRTATRSRNRRGPERPGTPAGRALEAVEKVVTGIRSGICQAPLDVRHRGFT